MKTFSTIFFKPKLKSFLENIDDMDEEELILILKGFNDIITHVIVKEGVENETPDKKE